MDAVHVVKNHLLQVMAQIQTEHARRAGNRTQLPRVVSSQVIRVLLTIVGVPYYKNSIIYPKRY